MDESKTAIKLKDSSQLLIKFQLYDYIINLALILTIPKSLHGFTFT